MVKTAASHAVNIGSNPVRVTSDSSQMSQNRNATSRIAQSVTLLVVSTRNHYVGLLVVRERKESAAHRFRSQPLRWVARGERWGLRLLIASTRNHYVGLLAVRDEKTVKLRLTNGKSVV